MTAPADEEETSAEQPAPRPGHRRYWTLLLVIAAVAAVVRISYALAVVADDPVGGDAYFYHHAADLLADGEGFIVPYEFLEYGVRTEAADHPPLFIAYLALWSLIGLGSVKAHLVAGALLGVGAVVLIGALGRRVAGPTTGLVAALIAAVYPNLFGWDAMLLSEPTATLGVLAVCLAAYAHRSSPTTRSAVVLGALIGLAALTRAELLLLSVLVAVPVVLARTSLDLRARLGQLVVAGVACVAVLAPWIGYNLTRFEEPVLLSSGLDVTLGYTNCDNVYRGTFIGYWDFACVRVPFGSDDPEYLALDQSERGAIFRKRALDYAGEHAGEVPAVIAARIGRVAGVFRPGQQVDLDIFVEGRDARVARWGMWSYQALALASIAGFIVLGRRGVPRYPLVGPIVTVVVAAAMTFGATRYRAAAEPVLCVLAAVALVAVLEHVRARRTTAP